MFGSNNSGQPRSCLATRANPLSAFSRVLLVVVLIAIVPLSAWAGRCTAVPSDRVSGAGFRDGGRGDRFDLYF